MPSETNDIHRLDQLINIFNKRFQLDENHTVVAVFENNDNDRVIGWSVIEIGVQDDYPVYSTSELFRLYDNNQTTEEPIEEEIIIGKK